MLGHVARSAGDWLVQWSTALLCFLNLGDDPGNAMTIANSGEKPEIARVAKSWFWQLSHVLYGGGLPMPFQVVRVANGKFHRCPLNFFFPFNESSRCEKNLRKLSC